MSVAKSVEMLDFIIEQLRVTQNYFDDGQPDEITMFCLCIMDRLRCSSAGLRELFQKVEENPILEYACGIILRAALLDFIIVLNAFDISGESENKHREFCSDMLIDSVRHTLNNISQLYGNDASMLSKMYSNMASKYTTCFEPYINHGTRPTLKPTKQHPVKEMAERIKNSAELNKFKSVYEGYLYYSKYDHFGLMSYGLSQEISERRIEKLNKTILLFPCMFYYTQALITMNTPGDAFLYKQHTAIKIMFGAIC